MSLIVGALVMLAPPAAFLAGYIFRCSGGGDDGLTDLLSSSSGDGCGVSPASQEAIEALDDVLSEGCDDGGGGRECAICLDQPVVSRWKEMPCGHRFHGGCVAKWLRAPGTCPRLSPPDAAGARRGHDGPLAQ